MAVAVDVEGIGADHAFEQAGLDVERLLLEFERPAAPRFVDEQLGGILAAGQEHAGET